ncbi:MAG: D-alanyl-D-alanine carboxypeptidase family protein [Lachnospiraceae bacterium]
MYKYIFECDLMNGKLRSFGLFLFSFLFFLQTLLGVVNIPIHAEMEIESPCAAVMDVSTGALLYEKNCREHRSPASITKLMTLYLIFEAIKQGEIQLTDMVTVSAYAKSMGGSQVYLEEGETQTVETMIKCIIVASGNDASVAMAEFLGGTEGEFVQMMNEKAALLGMNDTNYVDCCGLTDDPMHYSCAYDIALLSRELLRCYPDIKNYSRIWMEDILHITRNGESAFTLNNTNKLLRQYEYATGLKTGMTSQAKYCLSASASKDGRELVAVILGAPTSQVRFSEAKQLLEYGYRNTTLYESPEMQMSSSAYMVSKAQQGDYIYNIPSYSVILPAGTDMESIQREIIWRDDLCAPLTTGEKVGILYYFQNDVEIGAVDITLEQDIPKISLGYCIRNAFQKFLL